MNNITTKEDYNVQFQELAELVTYAKAHLTALEKRLKKLYPNTTQYRLEQEQKQFREQSYYCDCHLDNKAAAKHKDIPVQYTLVKQSTKP